MSKIILINIIHCDLHLPFLNYFTHLITSGIQYFIDIKNTIYEHHHILQYNIKWMKLVSVNAVLIASCNISLFVNCYRETNQFPPFALLFLSVIYIALLILLQYEHRKFKSVQINISESSWLFGRYIYLFAVGIALTLLQKFQLLQHNYYIENYIFLAKSIYYTLLYFTLNFILGNTYLYLFYKEYAKANKIRLQSDYVSNSLDENCAICYNSIDQGQKIAKILCMHKFHTVCLNKWIKQRQSCPLCQCSIQLHF